MATRDVDAPLILSVSGARGLVGRTMTPGVAADYATAFGSFVRTINRKRSPLICIGRDSRPSGASLSSAAIGGLCAAGCRVIDLGIVATPTVAVMIGAHKSAGGMVVTASHNPIEWNGLKCLNSDGIAPPPAHASEIVRRYRERDFTFAPPTFAASIERDDRSNAIHVDRVLKNIDVRAVRKAKFKVVLDSVNGAGCVSGRMLLEKLGCTVVHLNGTPSGLFAHQPEPVEVNLTALAEATRRAKAACGFAQDPDADRLAIIDDTGRYIGEEYTLVVAAKQILDEAQRARSATAKRSKRQRIIAVNLSTSRMIDDLASCYANVKVVRSAVGEANVVAAMQKHGAASIVGGEGNGGVIVPGVCWVRDSLSAMALTLHLMARQRTKLSDIVAELPRYAMIKHKFDLSAIGGTAAIEAALRRVASHFKDATCSTVDGVRLDFEDGWVHLRPSNTEPIVRLIAEAHTKENAWALIEAVASSAQLQTRIPRPKSKL